MSNSINSQESKREGEIFPEIEISKIRREQIKNIFDHLSKLENRIKKLEKKRWWKRKKNRNEEISNPVFGQGKKKRTKRRYKKKKKKYRKKRTKKKSLRK